MVPAARGAARGGSAATPSRVNTTTLIIVAGPAAVVAHAPDARCSIPTSSGNCHG